MKRTRSLIQPGFQLRLVGSFLAMSVLAMTLQLLLLGYLLRRVAVSAESGSGELVDSIPQVLLQAGGLSLAILLPLMVLLGIQRTFRIAGPIYRFESYLSGVASGETQGPCKIRENDELTGLCDRINEAVSALRAERSSQEDASRAA